MQYHNKTGFSVLEELESSVSGLSDDAVRIRQERYGENKLQEKKKKTMLQHFWEQFQDAMILILVLAAGVSFAVACAEGDSKEFVEPVLILLIVVMLCTWSPKVKDFLAVVMDKVKKLLMKKEVGTDE